MKRWKSDSKVGGKFAEREGRRGKEGMEDE